MYLHLHKYLMDENKYSYKIFEENDRYDTLHLDRHHK